MILKETFTLANGIQIPKLGLGTWFIDDDKAAVDFVISADDFAKNPFNHTNSK